MKMMNYLKDKAIYLIFWFFSLLITTILLLFFNTNITLVLLVMIFYFFSIVVPLIYEYIKKRIFYNSFKNTLDNLDKKYLITEMISSSSFIEGKVLLEYLYEINKSMHEEINNYKYLSNELIEYIELWCHEIKTPIATSKLIVENNFNEVTKNILEEIENIESYVEQVLYYSKSDFVEKDYIISDVNLNKVINTVIKRNKKDFINKKIKVKIQDLKNVKSDSKWLEFILNQIIVNSIKYSKAKNSFINIYQTINKNNLMLCIEDNGIGIDENDLPKVFDNGFTGKNGRTNKNSTGIGLYLCKKLCSKLGHEILIDSKINVGTKVNIIFPNNSMIQNLTEM